MTQKSLIRQRIKAEIPVKTHMTRVLNAVLVNIVNATTYAIPIYTDRALDDVLCIKDCLAC